MNANATARRVCATAEIQQRADWCRHAHTDDQDATVLSMVTQLGMLAQAHGREDAPAMRMLAVRLAGDALAIVEGIDQEPAR